MGTKRQLTRGHANNGTALADWLNDTSVLKEARERVAAIARDLAALSKSAEQVFMRVPDAQSWKAIEALGIPKETTLLEVFKAGLVQSWKTIDTGTRNYDQAALARAVEALDSYRFRPYVNLARTPQSVHAFPIRLVPANWNPNPTVGEVERARGNWPALGDKTRGPIDDQDAWMVLLLMELSSSGNMERLRECGCGRWFYRGRPQKRHCSDACRRKACKPNVEHRRTYMREYMQKVRQKDKKITAKGNDDAKG